MLDEKAMLALQTATPEAGHGGSAISLARLVAKLCWLTRKYKSNKLA